MKLTTNQTALIRFLVSKAKEQPENWMDSQDMTELESIHQQATLEIRKAI